jgi:uncharacterized protein (DUF1778 family)
MSKSAIIPIRFTEEEKLFLQSQANISGVSLSTFVRCKVTNKMPKKSKAKELLDLLDSLNISKEDIDQADAYSKEMRKNFKLTPTR